MVSTPEPHPGPPKVQPPTAGYLPLQGSERGLHPCHGPLRLSLRALHPGLPGPWSCGPAEPLPLRFRSHLTHSWSLRPSTFRQESQNSGTRRALRGHLVPPPHFTDKEGGRGELIRSGSKREKQQNWHGSAGLPSPIINQVLFFPQQALLVTYWRSKTDGLQAKNMVRGYCLVWLPYMVRVFFCLFIFQLA